MAEQASSPKSFWLVNASYGAEDQTESFIKDGIWQNSSQDRYFDKVRAMQPGERIAIKSSYTRKQGLPFDNRGHAVSVMDINAIGVITRNHNDGISVDVEWQTRFTSRKEWYFYTYPKIVWQLFYDDWYNKELSDFAFNNKPQDIDRFRNAPYWKGRFGDATANEQRFGWTKFYEEFADRLINYKDRRQELVSICQQTRRQI